MIIICFYRPYETLDPQSFFWYAKAYEGFILPEIKVLCEDLLG